MFHVERALKTATIHCSTWNHRIFLAIGITSLFFALHVQ